MNPLSIAACVWMVPTASLSLSLILYGLVPTIREAPRDVSEIARGISELSWY